MYVIVGLGNPESDYSNTRHNMGFNTINKIAEQYNIEVNKNIKKLIDMIHKKGIKVGISLNPETPVSFLVPYLKEIDLVLIMSVKPGKGGQTFLESATSKIQFLNKMRQAGSYSYMIEVDGGINDVTKHQCAGADMLVAGSFITNYDNYQRQINKLR